MGYKEWFLVSAALAGLLAGTVICQSDAETSYDVVLLAVSCVMTAVAVGFMIHFAIVLALMEVEGMKSSPPPKSTARVG